MTNKNSSSGQALLLILLAMAAIVTVASSIASRSITDINISTKEVDSQRAFSAAEAGVEHALVGDTASGNLGDSTFNVSVTNYSENSRFFIYPSDISSGDTASVWFVSHDPNDNLVCNSPTYPCFAGSSMRVCWGRSGISASAPDTPAMETSIFYTSNPGNYSTTRVARVTADPNAGRRPVDSFSAPDNVPGCTINGQSFAFQRTINFAAVGIASAGTPNGLQFARVRLLYNTIDQPLAIEVTGGTLPSQGRQIDSVGTITSNEATRKVQVFSLYSDAPPIFDSAIFTTGDLTK